MKDSAYKQAGVDIEAGAALVERIKPHVEKTRRKGVMSGLGGFGALFDLKQTAYQDPVLVSSTDGVGTKLRIAIDMDRHDTVGIDLVAMCVNDIVVQGAEPLFFLDYFASGTLEVDKAEQIIGGIAEGCKQAGCALIGGETAEMPGMYAGGDYDLAGFAVGAAERERLIAGERIGEGDVILGLASSGLHSNGYSLVRKLTEGTQGHSYDSAAPFETRETRGENKDQNSTTLGDIFLTPTRIYVRSILAALTLEDEKGRPLIKGMANITGGGLTENIPRCLPAGMCAVLDAKGWVLPPVFAWLAEIGRLSHVDLAATLNCGIGMAIVCAEDAAPPLEQILSENGESVFRIGTIEQGDTPEDPANRSKIRPTIRIDNRDTAWPAN